MSYQLPELTFAYDALEPYMDEETVRIHHTRHHQKYVDNFNEAVKNTPMEEESLEEIFPRISRIPDAVAKNAGQVFNHSLFWRSLKPNGRKEPTGQSFIAEK